MSSGCATTQRTRRKDSSGRAGSSSVIGQAVLSWQPPPISRYEVLHQKAPEKPRASATGRLGSARDFAWVLKIALDDLQGGAADRRHDVGVDPERRQPGPRLRELLTEQP